MDFGRASLINKGCMQDMSWPHVSRIQSPILLSVQKLYRSFLTAKCRCRRSVRKALRKAAAPLHHSCGLATGSDSKYGTSSVWWSEACLRVHCSYGKNCASTRIMLMIHDAHPCTRQTGHGCLLACLRIVMVDATFTSATGTGCPLFHTRPPFRLLVLY